MKEEEKKGEDEKKTKRKDTGVLLPTIERPRPLEDIFRWSLGGGRHKWRLDAKQVTLIKPSTETKMDDDFGHGIYVTRMLAQIDKVTEAEVQKLLAYFNETAVEDVDISTIKEEAKVEESNSGWVVCPGGKKGAPFSIEWSEDKPDHIFVEESIALLAEGSVPSVESFHILLDKTAASLSQEKNIQDIYINDDETRVLVFGDLYGAFDDFHYIFKKFGHPKETLKYVLNGNFVDRGERGIAVLSALMTLRLAFPERVFLNRGNHEDVSINRSYGFIDELKSTFGIGPLDGSHPLIMSLRLFYDALPIVTIVNNRVYIAHGGVPRFPDDKVRSLQEYDRTRFELDKEHADLYAFRQLDKEEAKYSIMMRDILWSDPRPNYGVALNARGYSIEFGPDVTQRFLSCNEFDFIIRSHEVKPSGAYLYEAHVDRLLTLFTATNQNNYNNKGAVVVLQRNVAKPGNWKVITPFEDRGKDDEGGPLSYLVYRFAGKETGGTLDVVERMRRALFNIISNRLESIWGKVEDAVKFGESNEFILLSDLAAIMKSATRIEVSR